MGSSVLTLDQIWSATSTFSVKWSAGIESNKAHRVLHYLLCRLYDEGRGQLMNAQLTLAQTTLSEKLGISRQWIGELVGMLERLLVMLSKSRQRKTLVNKPAKSTWQFSPSIEDKRILLILKKEKTPP